MRLIEKFMLKVKSVDIQLRFFHTESQLGLLSVDVRYVTGIYSLIQSPFDAINQLLVHLGLHFSPNKFL